MAGQPCCPVEDAGGCGQAAEDLVADVGGGASEGPGDGGRGARGGGPAADGPGDLADLGRGHDLADERQGVGFLVGSVNGFIVVVLAVTTVTSLITSKRQQEAEERPKIDA